MFLTQGVTSRYPPYSDKRMKSIENAINFANCADLLVSDSSISIFYILLLRKFFNWVLPSNLKFDPKFSCCGLIEIVVISGTVIF